MTDEQLGNVDQRKLIEDTPHQEGVWTEIGQAEVKVDMFGHAKVHVIREHDQTSRNWKVAVFVLVIGLIGAAWAWLGGKEDAVTPEISAQSKPVAAAHVTTEVALDAASPVVAAPVVSVTAVTPQPKVDVRPAPVVSRTASAVPVAKPPVTVRPVKPFPAAPIEVVTGGKPAIVSPVKPASAVVAPHAPELVSPIQTPVEVKPQGDITY